MPARVLVTCHRIQSRILRYGTAKEYFEVDKYYTTFCDTKNRYNLQLALTLGNALSLQLCSTLVKHLEKNLLMKQLLRTFQIHLSNPTKDTHTYQQQLHCFFWLHIAAHLLQAPPPSKVCWQRYSRYTFSLELLQLPRYYSGITGCTNIQISLDKKESSLQLRLLSRHTNILFEIAGH